MIAAQNSTASSAFESRFRKTTSTNPPTNTAMAILITSAAKSRRSRLAIGSRSLLAIITASDNATPNRRDQVRRRLTASPFRYLGKADGSETRGQLSHNQRTILRRHQRPPRNFLDRAPAAVTKPRTGVKRTNIDARGLYCGHESRQVLNRQRT